MESTCTDTIKSIQIETTSRCNLNCITCLKPTYQNVWQNRNLDKTLFQRIVTEINGSKPNVHLQGWGEPLVQDDFLDYVKILKEADFAVTFTTNGTVMSSELAADLIKTGLDGITFSMAGCTAVTHDGLRGHGSFNNLTKAISIFVATKKKSPMTGPGIAVSYLLTKKTVQELPRAVSWARRMGVDAFVTVALTQAGGMQQYKLQFLPSSQQEKRFRYIRFKANLAGLPGKIKLKMNSFSPTLTPVCDKNPIENLFISASGDVAPCVFLAPPIKGPITWYTEDGFSTQEPLIMGNLSDLSLKEIWEGERYQRFRETFRQRCDYFKKRLGKVSYSLAGPSELESAVTLIEEFFSNHPAPVECRLCRKLDGY